MDEDKVLSWMVREVLAGEFREIGTGEPQFTQLAEAAADAFESWDWLDDELSPVWDLAIQAFEEAE